MAEGTCPSCGHPYLWNTPSPAPRTCVWCGGVLPAAGPNGDPAERRAWRVAMTTGALAVFLAGAIAASVEWFGPARGGKLLMQALTGAILVAALAWIWWRYRRNRGRGRPA